MISNKTFDLFAKLEANNHKEWFDRHRDQIQEASGALASVLVLATKALSSTPMPLIGGPATMQRIYRDIRFAANKAPYKTSVSGLMTPDGTKSGDEGVAYLQLDQRGGHMSGGYYNLTPVVLKRFRDKIVARPEQFRAVLDDVEREKTRVDR